MMSSTLKNLQAHAGYGRQRWSTTEDFDQFLDNYGLLILSRVVSIIDNSELRWADQLELVEELEHDFGLDLQHLMSDGTGSDARDPQPKFVAGDRVHVVPLEMEATVIQQIKHYDCGDVFYGNVELLYDDGVKGISHCWQLRKLNEQAD